MENNQTSIYSTIANDISKKNNEQQKNLNGKEIDLNSIIPPTIIEDSNSALLFDVNQFVSDLKIKSEQKNFNRAKNSNRITSYSIAHDCIRQVYFQIMNYPAKSYSSLYLPIELKSVLGNSVHDFIQKNSSVFTEIEASIKIPSIRVSCRLDALINNDVIVEIKSCTFKDFENILKNKKPRDADFLQVTLYKYLLENHLEEAKEQTNIRTHPPKLDNYKIRYFQFIYVANDILSSESSNISESLKQVNKIKKLLDSKHNQFYFILPITIDLKNINITPHYTWIINKINKINYYLNNNKIPPKNDPFISNSCFFCIYKQICNQYT